MRPPENKCFCTASEHRIHRIEENLYQLHLKHPEFTKHFKHWTARKEDCLPVNKWPHASSFSKVGLGVVADIFNPSTWGRGVGGSLSLKPGLHIEFQEGQGYIVRPCLKKKKNSISLVMELAGKCKLKLLWETTSSLSQWLSSSDLTANVGEDVLEKRSPYSLLMEMQINTAIMEISLEIPQKIKTTIWPSCSTPGHISWGPIWSSCSTPGHIPWEPRMIQLFHPWAPTLRTLYDPDVPPLHTYPENPVRSSCSTSAHIPWPHSLPVSSLLAQVYCCFIHYGRRQWNGSVRQTVEWN